MTKKKKAIAEPRRPSTTANNANNTFNKTSPIRRHVKNMTARRPQTTNNQLFTAKHYKIGHGKYTTSTPDAFRRSEFWKFKFKQNTYNNNTNTNKRKDKWKIKSPLRGRKNTRPKTSAEQARDIVLKEWGEKARCKTTSFHDVHVPDEVEQRRNKYRKYGILRRRQNGNRRQSQFSTFYVTTLYR